jgi:hypothetical protein
VHEGQLTILDPFAAAPATPATSEAEETDEADEAAPKPKRTWPAVALWVGTLGSTIGALSYYAGGGQ